MSKRIFAVCLIVVIALAAVGCSGKKTGDPVKTAAPVAVPAGPGPDSPDLKATAEKVLKLQESNDWNTLYDYVYVDIQKSISKDDFVTRHKQRAAKSKIKYKNYKLGEPKMIAKWEDTIDKKNYDNVAEVPYTVDVMTPRGEIKVNNNIHLIQTPEKNWRYLWINT